MLFGVDHFAFAVSDLERSVEFYRDLLGLEFVLRRVWDEEYAQKMVGIPDAVLDIALLKLPGDKGSPLTDEGKFAPEQGDILLELIEYQYPKGSPVESHVYTPGNAHICFLDNDIDALYERLRDAGVDFISEPLVVVAGPNEGKKAVYLRDPDGIIVQVIQP